MVDPFDWPPWYDRARRITVVVACALNIASVACLAYQDRSLPSLRDLFEIDHRYVVVATLAALARDGPLAPSVVHEAIKAHGVNPEKLNPAVS